MSHHCASFNHKNTYRFCCLVSLVRRRSVDVQRVKPLQQGSKLLESVVAAYSQTIFAFWLRGFNLRDNQSWRRPFKASSLTSWLHPSLLFFDLAAEEERNCLASVWPSCYSIQHIETPVLIYCVWIVGSGWIPAPSVLHMHCQEGTQLCLAHSRIQINTHRHTHARAHVHTQHTNCTPYKF